MFGLVNTFWWGILVGGVGFAVVWAIVRYMLHGVSTTHRDRGGFSSAIAGETQLGDSRPQPKSNQDLLESEARMEHLLSGLPLPVAVHSGSRWIYVNQACLELVGAHEVHEIVGKSVFRFMPEDRRDAVRIRFRDRDFLTNGTAVFSEQVLCLDGSLKQVEVTATAIVQEGKSACQLILRDITEQTRLKKELERAHRLETAGRMASQIAHDFNNLLAPLTAYPTLIREGLPPGHSVLEFVDEMEHTACRIAEINQQLLTLGRRGLVNLHTLDLEELVDSALVSQSLPETMSVARDFSSESLYVRGEAAQLHRALTNLIANACEAMKGEGTLTIRTRSIYLTEQLTGYARVEAGEYVRLDVGDSGVGMEQEILDRIFDPFFTTKSMDRKRGSGLGLSVVHGVVEDHKGYVTLASEPGIGTTFSIYFPATTAERVNSRTQYELPTGHGEKLLVVDDDPVHRNVTRHLLEWLGYDVKLAASGEEAIRLFRNGEKDLVVLDMILNGIDGAETYRQILDVNKSQKAIILSAYAMSPRIDYALQLGASTFVQKPIIPRNLANAVRNVLDLSPARASGLGRRLPVA